jgi:hypothetical protein
MFRFFTANPQVAKAKIAALEAELDGITAFVRGQGEYNSRLETRISELREEILAFGAALHKLRGQVHGPRAQETPRAPTRLDTGSLNPAKDELRRRAGIVAGRPTPHTGHNEDE